jgi:heme-degrading monooxygenase HmoA
MMGAARSRRAASSDTGFVAHSEIRVPPDGAAGLVSAFRARLGEVERWPGFVRLEVWQDERDPCRFVMVSWWDTRECFADYMRSESHRRSHDRIATGADAPRPAGLTRFQVVAR